ncbi:unnamed protein product, partial [Hymenolepis diminuta]
MKGSSSLFPCIQEMVPSLAASHHLYQLCSMCKSNEFHAYQLRQIVSFKTRPPIIS